MRIFRIGRTHLHFPCDKLELLGNPHASPI
jgi:hypothetical protein